MGLDVNDWIDDWFLMLSDDPDKLDKSIRSYQSVRMLAFISVIGTAVGQMLVLL